jgi:hypothetical protein
MGSGGEAPRGASCAGVRVEGVAGSSGGAPGSVRLPGGRAVTAGCAVVVATEARSAEALLGPALAACPSKAEPGVGTCNLYFRWGPAWKECRNQISAQHAPDAHVVRHMYIYTVHNSCGTTCSPALVRGKLDRLVLRQPGS